MKSGHRPPLPLFAGLGEAVLLIPDVGLAAPDADPSEYREFFQAVPSGMFILDWALRIRHVNPAAVLLFQAGAGALQGRDFAEIFAPRSRADVEKAFSTMQDDPAAAFRRLTAEAASVEGSVIPVELTILRLGALGDPGFGAVVRDLRDRPAKAAAPAADPQPERPYTLGELLMANRLRELV